jgi:hypothetical protein
MKKQKKDMEAILKEADQFLKKMELMYYTTYKPKRTRHYMEGKPIFGDSKDVRDVHGLHFIINKDNKLAFRAKDMFMQSRLPFSNAMLNCMFRKGEFGTSEVGYVTVGGYRENYVTLSGIMRILCTKRCRGSTLFAMYLFLHIAPSIHDIFPDITHIDQYSRHEREYINRFRDIGDWV